MYWADKLAKEIISSGKYKPYWVDDMKTPSGYAHVGSLRGPIIHSMVYRALKDQGVNVKFTFVINDFDPADELPAEFKEKLSEYMGFPLKKVPSPDPKFESMGDMLANDLKSTMQELGVESEYLSSWELYHEGKFDGVIKEALDASEKIQEVYQKVSGSEKKEKGWLPLQVICEKCGKMGTTRVHEWDGKEVSYKCEPEMVSWAKGCGHEGKMSPFGGNAKLPWKVDWAAHWKVIGVTIEGAGKDHGSAGGSYDIAMALCDEVFHIEKPFKLPYEFFLIGGKKMSSSKGLGLKSHDITVILPPAVARFLFSRTDHKQAIDFDPNGTMTIPELYDEYDRCWQAYIDGSDEDLGRAFELAQIKDVPEKTKIYLPRFREVAQVIQMGNIDVAKYFEGKKGESLSGSEKEILEERIKYAKTWLDNYAPEDAIYSFKEKLPQTEITKTQQEYLGKIAEVVDSSSTPEEMEKIIYSTSQEMKLAAKDAFGAIYSVLIGKNHGPKVAWLIFGIGKDKVKERFQEASK
jgi:lysyl-tRNA synthetase class 1